MPVNSPTPVPSPKTESFPFRGTIIVILLGLLLRFALAGLAVRWGYVFDHFDNIGMGLTAAQTGLLKVYSVDKEHLAVVKGSIYEKGEFVPIERTAYVLPNYPPLCISLFWLQAKCLPLLTGSSEANTFGARLVMSSGSVLAELLQALIVFLIARELYGHRAGLLAGAVCWLFPPIAMNGAFWGQVDAFVTAPAVLMVWLMMKRRWAWAGLCLGIAMLLKPQGVLLGPILLFGALTVAEPDDGVSSMRVVRRLVISGLAALASIVILTLPWMAADGLAWFKRSYVASYTEAFPYITMVAFNIWYFDALQMDTRPVGDQLSSDATMLGVTKDMWGRMVLLAAMCATAWFCWKKYRRAPVGLVAFACIWLWSCFMLPTRGHERFIVYGMPFLIALAPGYLWLWAVAGMVMVVGVAEQTWHLWLSPWYAGKFDPSLTGRYHEGMQANYRQMLGTGQPVGPPPTYDDAFRTYWSWYRGIRSRYAPWELLFTVLSVAAYAWGVFVVFAAKLTPRRSDRSDRSD